MPFEVDSSSKFSDLYAQFNTEQNAAKVTNYSKDKHLRFQDGKGLYFRKGLRMPESWFKRASNLATQRETRRGDAGQRIWQSIANEYSSAKADQIFRDVLNQEPDGPVQGAQDYRRAQITLGQLDRIKQALDSVDSNVDPYIQEAASLHEQPNRAGFEKFVADNSDLLLSDNYLKSMNAKISQDLVRAGIAFDAYDRLAKGADMEPLDKEILMDTFLKAIGTKPDDPPRPKSDEALKKWMVDRLDNRFVDKNGDYELNFGDDTDINVSRFKDKVKNPSLAPDEKFALMREGIRQKILDKPGNVKDYSQNITKGLLRMKHPDGTRSDDIDDLFEGAKTQANTTLETKTRKLRLEDAERLVGNCRPGTGTFTRIAAKHHIDPNDLTKPETDFISTRLGGLARGKALENLALERAGKPVPVPLDQNWVEKQTDKLLQVFKGDQSQRLVHRRIGEARQVVHEQLAQRPLPGREMIDHIALQNGIHPNQIPNGGKAYIEDQLKFRAEKRAKNLTQNNVDADWVQNEIRSLVTHLSANPQAVQQHQPQALAQPQDTAAPKSLLECHEEAMAAANQAVRNLLDPSTQPTELIRSLCEASDKSRAYTDRSNAASGKGQKPGDDDYASDLADFFDQTLKRTLHVGQRYGDLLGADGRGAALLFATGLVNRDSTMEDPERPNIGGGFGHKEEESIELSKFQRTLINALAATAVHAGAPDPSNYMKKVMAVSDNFATKQATKESNQGRRFDSAAVAIPGKTLRESGLNNSKQINALVPTLRDQVVQRAERIRAQNPSPDVHRPRSDTEVSGVSEVGSEAGWKDGKDNERL